MERDHLLALLVVFIILIYLFYNPEKCIKNKFSNKQEKQEKQENQMQDQSGKNRHEKPKRKTKVVDADMIDKELVAKVKNNVTDIGLKGLRR